MTNETKHTPTPWFAGTECSEDYYYSGYCIGTAINKADVCFYGVEKANAAHIVRCVNSHDALVGALKGVRGVVEERCAFNNNYWPLTMLDRALAAAGVKAGAE
jgi:hypothetical protein